MTGHQLARQVLFSSMYEDVAGDLCVIHSRVPPLTEIAAFKLRYNEANCQGLEPGEAAGLNSSVKSLQ